MIFRIPLPSLTFIEIASKNPNKVQKALRSIAAFYFFQTFYSFTTLQSWVNAQSTYSHLDANWLLFWIKYLPSQSGADYIVFAFYIVSSVLCSFFYPYRFIRGLLFLGILLANAFVFSFNMYDVHQLPLIYIAGMFLFLPNRLETNDNEKKRQFLLFFWGAQAILLLTYTLSGFWKIWSLLFQFANGQINAFSPEAFALQIASVQAYTLRDGLTSNFISMYPWVGNILYVGAIYMQFFSLYAGLKPALHQTWAILLISFHIATYLFFNINFANSIFLLVILLVNSPFSSTFSWETTLYDMPLIGILLKHVNKMANKLKHATMRHLS